MSEFFKLDINSYTKRELEELLNLKYPYTIQNVIESHKMLVEKLTGVNKGRHLRLVSVK